jgi:hypothetical protein
LTDALWNLYSANKVALDAFGVKPSEVDGYPNLFDIALRPGSSVRERLIAGSTTKLREWERFVRSQVMNFRIQHASDSSPWFAALKDRLMEYPEFAAAWEGIDEALITRIRRHRRLKGWLELGLPTRSGGVATYFVVSLQASFDPRFRCELYIPKDRITTERQPMDEAIKEDGVLQLLAGA